MCSLLSPFDRDMSGEIRAFFSKAFIATKCQTLKHSRRFQPFRIRIIHVVAHSSTANWRKELFGSEYLPHRLSALRRHIHSGNVCGQNWLDNGKRRCACVYRLICQQHHLKKLKATTLR
jgi:hypothetical protein